MDRRTVLRRIVEAINPMNLGYFEANVAVVDTSIQAVVKPFGNKKKTQDELDAILKVRDSLCGALSWLCAPRHRCVEALVVVTLTSCWLGG